MPGVEPILIVHGGAGDIPSSKVNGKVDGVRVAARNGYKVFEETGSMLKAAMKAVEYLEDNEYFNAGRGSCLTEDGVIELEALVMEGKNLKAGGVTGVKNIKNPVQLAKMVMDKTPHVVLAGKHANMLAEKSDVATADDSYLYTMAAKESLNNFTYEGTAPNEGETGDTVGAIGIDKDGHLVVCTSTGGLTGKMTGRVGDTPMPGSGSYADDEIGAVAATGNGDGIMRYNLSSRILLEMKYTGKSAQQATEDCVKDMKRRTEKTAGAVTISKTGDIGIAFSSKRMAWAYQKANKLHFGIEQGDNGSEVVQSH